MRRNLCGNHRGVLMKLSQRLGAILAIATVLLGPATAFGAPQDAVLNKEGYWGIDVDHGACAASMTLQGGSTFLLRAVNGQVSFGLLSRTPLVRGNVVRLETEADGFDFRASYGDDATTLFFEGDLDAQTLAALRLARQVRILADGRQVAAMTFEGTGFPGALDGVVACSRGEKGWWGPGVGAEPAADGAAPDKLTKELVYNKEDVWGIAVGTVPGLCVAQAELDGDRRLQILAAEGQMGLAVVSDSGPLPRGRKGKVKTDDHAFDFKPQYGRDGAYMSSDRPLDSQAILALSHAKWLGMTVDGRELVDAAVEGTGFAELLQSVAACSRGEKGWWGEGPPPAR